MRRHPRRTRTDPQRPRAWATSDASGFVGQHEDMVWQLEYAGTGLINKRILVFPDEYDTPNPQLKTIILQPDPLPIMNARPEAYSIEEVPVSNRVTLTGGTRVTLGSPLQSIRIVSGDYLT